MTQYYITSYEDGYCFVHDSGRPDKFIFSQEKACHIKLKEAKLYRIDSSYFEIVYNNGSVERIPYLSLDTKAILGTKYRDMGILQKEHILTPLH